MLKGTIIKGIGGFYYVDTEKGVYECRARGIFRKEGIKPAVGDTVKITILNENEKEGSLDVIEQRKTLLIRPRVANVEQAIIVFCSKKSKFEFRFAGQVFTFGRGATIRYCNLYQ